MRRLLPLGLASLFLTCFFAMTQSGLGGPDPMVMSTTTTTTSPATTQAVVYTCPMHKDVAATQPGVCPICGMKLVPKM